MMKRGVLSALLVAAACAPATQGFVFPLGRSAKAAVPSRTGAGHCSSSTSTGFVQPLRMSAATAEPPAQQDKETYEFQAEVSRYVRAMGERGCVRTCVLMYLETRESTFLPYSLLMPTLPPHTHTRTA